MLCLKSFLFLHMLCRESFLFSGVRRPRTLSSDDWPMRRRRWTTDWGPTTSRRWPLVSFDLVDRWLGSGHKYDKQKEGGSVLIDRSTPHWKLAGWYAVHTEMTCGVLSELSSALGALDESCGTAVRSCPCWLNYCTTFLLGVLTLGLPCSNKSCCGDANRYSSFVVVVSRVAVNPGLIFYFISCEKKRLALCWSRQDGGCCVPALCYAVPCCAVVCRVLPYHVWLE